MRSQRLHFAVLLVTAVVFGIAHAQTPSAPSQSPSPPQAHTLAQTPAAVTISLDQAIQMALQHNHTLLALRTTIQQHQARLAAAQAQTAVTRSQVTDSERTTTFAVATQFINIELAESTLELALEDLKSFQNTVDIGESRYKAGDISEGDLLKIKLQKLQFETDVSAAKLARLQGLSDLRQLLGYESIVADYDIAGSFDYTPVKGIAEDFQSAALKNRPDLLAAQQGIALAETQYRVQKSIAKRDV